MTTMNNIPPIASMPAEWQLESAIMIAWPHADTDWADILPDATDCYATMADAFSRHARVIIVAPDSAVVEEKISTLPCRDNISIVEIPTNDTWTRDYGPITVVKHDGTLLALNFGFNGWGLKFAANLDNQVTDRMHLCGVLRDQPANCLSFILEGGSIESDGDGTILTTSRCLLSPNRNGSYSQEEIEERLHRLLGAKKVLWLDHGGMEGDDTDGHIDTIARFAPGNVILYNGCSDPDDPHYPELKAMLSQLREFTDADGMPYHLVELPMPEPIYDADGRRLAATYANFLALPDVVFMPTYRQPMSDRLAAMTIEAVFERPVVPVDATTLIHQNGSLHCATMQIPLPLL
ncbi:MAG: agmatine deiminase family protein [Paramuribaculum sp.]|nr:agmatine deiminase family protein [Paramuribaculum sp.]